MDKKGQSLVIFVMLLPIIFVLILILGEVGNLLITQNKYESESRRVIKYGLKHIEEENIESKLNELININVEGEKTVSIKDSIIEIKIHKPNKILNINYDIDIDLIGYKENEKIKIERK